MTKTLLPAFAAPLMLGALATQTSAQESVLGGSEYTILPETWELSYDVAMSPYVDDYKKCLGYGDQRYNGTPNIEQQHRADVPRCAKVREKAIVESNAAVARRGRTATMPPEAVEEAFKVLGYIHIQRGRNFDDQYKLQQRAAEERRRQYEAAIAARDGALVAPDAQTKDMPLKDPSNAIDQ